MKMRYNRTYFINTELTLRKRATHLCLLLAMRLMGGPWSPMWAEVSEESDENYAMMTVRAKKVA